MVLTLTTDTQSVVTSTTLGPEVVHAGVRPRLVVTCDAADSHFDKLLLSVSRSYRFCAGV